jgi:hypothetical protein
MCGAGVGRIKFLTGLKLPPGSARLKPFTYLADSVLECELLGKGLLLIQHGPEHENLHLGGRKTYLYC